MFNLDFKDVARALIIAVLTGAVLAVMGKISVSGFDVFSADWPTLGKDFINGGFAGAIGYLIRNFFSTPGTGEPRKFLGAI